MHEHTSTALDGDVIVLGAVALAAFFYVAAAIRSPRRRPWPRHRIALWLAGLGCGSVATAGPLAEAAHSDFSAHMVSHVLLGMLAPVLLVSAAPVTLALRTLDVVPARRLSAILKSSTARFFAHPITALVLNVGGMWAIYTTGLYGAMTTNVLVMWVVNAHVFIAGYLFTASIIGIDPSPHRGGFALRSVILVVALAAHDILAKYLALHPPSGVPSTQAEAGGTIMYYAGDMVDLVIIAILWARWLARLPRALPVRQA